MSSTMLHQFEKLTKIKIIEGDGLSEASSSAYRKPLSGERRVNSIEIPLPLTESKIVSLINE
ncbi:hypothetical protein ACFTQL_10165 [Peribacillus butanolivorans]|uniref:hypothetical protein n=1 Tax=Peribacillus butanolivorans TaxID=421767 RepID=UPI003645DA88